MNRSFLPFLGASLFLLSSVGKAQNKAPDVPDHLPPEVTLLQPGLKLTLLAEHPDLVTPTGIDIDDQGRIWVAACHTHFRPDSYQGPVHDEILVFDRDGKNRKVFYNKTDATMHVEIGPDGWIYLAERDRILRVRDTDGDGIGDFEENLATLDTVADYPHNGLSGMAWHPDGGILFSLGENFGKDWTLTAKDGSIVRGRGEGGIFWATPDGSHMRRVARGFWNPFGLHVRSNGEIFAAENDPGSRPPCRLLYVVEGADYGFQWVYGSAPVHPFVAWNGELRGTLGMVHPSGEGPCAVVELGGGLLIPSWSNHCIDYFPLYRQGAGFTSQRIELLKGSDFFRPVCMTMGKDGHFYFTDWVFSSYQLHGRGRLWRLEVDRSQANWIQEVQEPPNDAAILAHELRLGRSNLQPSELLKLARSQDAYLSDAALTAIAKKGKGWKPSEISSFPFEDRLWAFIAMRKTDLSDPQWVRAMIQDPDPEIRFESLRWIADAVLIEFLPDVEKILAEPQIDFRIFEAALATWNTLRGNPGAGVTDPEVLVQRIVDPQTPNRVKAFALRLAPSNHAQLTIPRLEKLYASKDPFLSREVVHSLIARNTPESHRFLRDVALDESLDRQLRADAVMGLANALDADQSKTLVALAQQQDRALRHEALRSLRLRTLDPEQLQGLKALIPIFPESEELIRAITDPSKIAVGRPPIQDTQAWEARLKQLPGTGDIEAGRRIFFHSKVGNCASCHRMHGRGNVVGPDLSLVHRQGDSGSILRSILEPNRDLAPQFYTTVLELEDGTIFSGILLRSSSTDVFRDPTGKERTFKKSDIVQRRELKTSLMPMGLVEQLTDAELRDLLAFLTAKPLSSREP